MITIVKSTRRRENNNNNNNKQNNYTQEENKPIRLHENVEAGLGKQPDHQAATSSGQMTLEQEQQHEAKDKRNDYRPSHSPPIIRHRI